MNEEILFNFLFNWEMENIKPINIGIIMSIFKPIVWNKKQINTGRNFIFIWKGFIKKYVKF